MDPVRLGPLLGGGAVPVKAGSARWEPSASDNFRPGEVMDVVRDHDDRYNRVRDELEEYKAAYMTAWWDWVGADKGRNRRQRGYASSDLIEVNRVLNGVEVHVAQLFPRTRRAVVSRDEMGRGDPRVFQAALNAWWRRPMQLERIKSAVRQATLYPGSGFKVDVSAGRGNPVERVGLSVVPCWEMVLDADVADVADQRFRGHAYWRPVSALVNAYPQLEGKVKGVAREDYLRLPGRWSPGGSGGGRGRTPRFDSNVLATENKQRRPADGSRKDGSGGPGAWCRVLEFVNLVDGYEAGSGIVLQGRLELYLLDQDDREFYERPFHVSACPFATADGVPLPHVVSLLMLNEPEYMTRGVSPLRKVMPQQRELNLYRTEMARRTRKHVRKLVVNSADSETKQKLASAEDMEIIGLDGEGEPSKLVYQIPPPPPDAEFKEYMALVERDLDKVYALAPGRRGEVTKATAYEIQSVNLFDETEFGKHAMAVEEACLQVSQLVRAALVVALQQASDSEGGNARNRPGQKVAATAVVEGDAPAAVDVAAADNAEATGKASAGVDPAALPATGGPPASATSATAGPVSVVVQQGFAVLDPETDQMMDVTVAALDGNFKVAFVEGAVTPMTEAAQQQNLLAVEPLYQALWDLVVKGGPVAIFARRYMAALHEKLKLPRDLHPDELERAAKEEAAQAEPPPPPPEEAVKATRAPPGEGTRTFLAVVTALGEKGAAVPGFKEAMAAVVAGVNAGDAAAVQAALAEGAQSASMAGAADVEAEVTALAQMVAEAAGAGDAPPVEGDGAAV